MGQQTWPNRSCRGCGSSAHAYGSAGLPRLVRNLIEQGASQAVEDAVTIATCLELAVENNVAIREAMKAYEYLRFNRTVATMNLGKQVREVQFFAGKPNSGRDGTKWIYPSLWILKSCAFLRILGSQNTMRKSTRKRTL
jgi:hypothetical protein